jgi:glutamate/aspartate transport system substrate-binding protein
MEDCMKRWLVMVMAAVGALTLAGPAGAQPLEGTLKRIKDTGTFKIGFRENSPPFSYLGADKKPLGYSVDLCERIARATQQELKLADLKIQYVPVTVESRLDAVANGTVDIECGSTTMTLARQEKVDFTNLTFVDGGGFLVARGSAIRGVTDLAGKRIGVIPGTTTEGALKAELQRAGVTASLVNVPDHNGGFAAVQGGQADAYASDQIILVGLLVQANAADKFALADQQFSFEPYALMVRRNDSAFRLVANRTLARIYRSGDIGQIFSRWFGVLGKPSPGLVVMFGVLSTPE